ncbi:cadmium, cobalt and zinc/H(+)-K(+) antiporter [Reticulibacter mediterranei]|uniref:Cadmium, cobalt and zinc/H(+)-K(+) antiporter n=1 Tax=Reticulibacter mediterranei TaxID=2778369 RepID=A0A8J3IGV2_9CHLR|nr:cation diffusion facilitator family transporter [Reticulibacter mediterranei]GHO90525.1 cadmium, cobalt and zinc/H(+)-K(+) antiporter [Reticulibacter mediterranei]
MSGGQHKHNHTHGMAKNTLRLAFFLTFFILAAELVGGLLANSLALLSDAGHVVTDLFALGLAWFATAQAERPANARKTFGYHRVGILAAQINAITLILITVAILWEAVQRFQHPEPIQPGVMFLSAAIGIGVNLYIGFGLQKEKENLNMRAAALHVFGDVGASVAVILAGIIILITGWTPADPLLSVAIAALIAWGAWRLLRETTDILLEATPKALNMHALVQDMRRIEGVQDVHDLHVWSITSDMYALSCHTLIDNQLTSESSVILRNIETLLKSRYKIAHSTIQFEHHAHQDEYCSVNGLYCQLDARPEQHCHDHDDEHEHEQHDHMPHQHEIEH